MITDSKQEPHEMLEEQKEVEVQDGENPPLQEEIEEPKKKRKAAFSVSMITRVAIFSAVSILLYMLTAMLVPIPIFSAVPWLSLHFDEIPMLIAGFAYGPLAGFLVVLIKSALSLALPGVNLVGVFADFLMSAAMVVSAAWIYKLNRSMKGAITALIISSFVQVAVAVMCNLYFLVDMYALMLDLDIRAFFESAAITEHLYYQLLIPFNFIKNIIVCILTFFTYKSTHRVMDRIKIGR